MLVRSIRLPEIVGALSVSIAVTGKSTFLAKIQLGLKIRLLTQNSGEQHDAITGFCKKVRVGEEFRPEEMDRLRGCQGGIDHPESGTKPRPTQLPTGETILSCAWKKD
nr:hypothetical protein Iba_chr10cCG13970 [Ipomoea batatas]